MMYELKLRNSNPPGDAAAVSGCLLSGHQSARARTDATSEFHMPSRCQWHLEKDNAVARRELPPSNDFVLSFCTVINN
jgi:hypothetical protein